MEESGVLKKERSQKQLQATQAKEHNMPKNTRIVGFDGPPCRRCGRPTEIREHERITEKELAKPSYYTRWYNCRNQNCRTTLIMPPEFKVWMWNENPGDGTEATRGGEQKRSDVSSNG
jgi:hypothetical protein